MQADSLPSEPPGKPRNTGVGSLSLLQGIFLTQGLNPRLLHCKQILYRLIQQGNGASDKCSCNAKYRSSIIPSLGLPGGSDDKEFDCNSGDLGSIPGLGRFPGEGNSYPLQYSSLENSMDCTVHGVAKSQTRLSDFHFH